MSSLLYFEYSPWLIILCLAIGVGYSYLQYQKKSSWNKRVNQLLAISRAVLVSLLAILFLGPTVRAVRHYYEKPLMVFAIDNSESIGLTTDSATRHTIGAKLIKVKAMLENNGWLVKMVNLAGEDTNPDAISYDQPRTNLTGMVKVAQSKYHGLNLKGILLVSDGIFNAGFSPDFISALTPIYTLGLGDTIPRKDLSIINIRNNKTVYQDNKFPVEVSIRNEGLGKTNTILSIYNGNKLLDKTEVTIDPGTRLIEHRFILQAEKSGKQRLSVVLGAVDGEMTLVNNHRSFYIDVVEGQQKVLIAADVPTPDIKAIRAAIEQNEHFVVDVSINKQVTRKDYDLIVFVQSPAKKMSTSPYLSLMETEIPKLFLVGSLTSIEQLNTAAFLNFSHSQNQYDQVTAVYNKEFTGFTMTSDIDPWLEGVPPLSVPFGKLTLGPGNEVLLYQKVGSIATGKPLVYVDQEGYKKGVIMGEGLWQWRLNEFRVYHETTRFDELISKLAMFLAAKPDKRQFKMYPLKTTYEVGEEIVFNAETYNELFEPQYGTPVSIQIKSKGTVKNFKFTPLEGSKQLRVNDLPEGIYNYIASTTINGKQQKVSGQFAVAKPNLEAADLTADYNVLKKLAHKTGGAFYTAQQLPDFANHFEKLKAKTIIHSREREILLINLPWILAFLVVLASGEWLIRKMMGGY